MTLTVEQISDKREFLDKVKADSLNHSGEASPLEDAFKEAGYNLANDSRVSDHMKMIFLTKSSLVFLIANLSKDDIERMKALRTSVEETLFDYNGIKKSTIDKIQDPETDDWNDILDVTLDEADRASVEEDISESQGLFKRLKFQTFLAFCFSVAMETGKGGSPYEFAMSFDKDAHTPQDDDGYYSQQCVEYVGGIDNWILIRDLVHDMYYPTGK